MATEGRDVAALVVRVATGLVFLAFGAAKFFDHATEVDSFRGYGLPFPELVVYAVGVLEVVGGALLLLGLLLRPVALLLAGNMVGAIIVSGIGKGEEVSLTLAPAMLAGMLFLLWAGTGRLALDAHR